MTTEDWKRARRLSISNRELLIATTENDLNKIDDLLKTSVDVDFKDREGNTALHWAVKCGHAKAAELLVSKGASLQSKNDQAETPIDIGKRVNDQNIINILRSQISPRKEETSDSKTKTKASLASKLQQNDTQNWFGVRTPVEFFSGRSEVLDSLHKMLQQEDSINEKSQFVCISGLGGVGKTELARMYVSTHSINYDNRIVWINAESYETLADSFRRLARDKLKISTMNADNKKKKLISIIEDIYTFFTNKKCIFIFDNAEKYKSQYEFDNGIEAFLPNSPSNRPHVLITSRNQKWPKNIKVLSLSVFSENEAMEFVEKSLDLNNNDRNNEIKALVNELQFYPLALQQAVSYISLEDEKLKNISSHFKIGNYLKQYDQKTKEYLKFTEDENDFTKTTYSTWNVTFDAIRRNKNGAEACQILEILSYFSSTDISLETIKTLVQDKIELAAAFELLKQFSIIDVNNEILSLHRLVIKVIRLHIQDEKREQEILYKALDLLRAATLTSENLEYAMSVWNFSSKYCKLIDEFSSLPSKIANKLLNSLRYEEAELFTNKALKKLDALTSKSHATKLNLIATKECAASVFECCGKYALSLKYYEDLYKMQKRISGPKSCEALEIRKKIARNLKNLGQYDNAVNLCDEIIEIETKTLGKNHFNTASTQHIKASILNCQGNYKEALSMLKEVLSIKELILGKDHVDTIILRNEIDGVLSNLGKFDKTTKIKKEKSIQKATKDVDLPDKILQKSDEGIGFLQQGKFREGLSRLEEAYESHKKIFGEDHPESLMIRRDMGEALRAIGKLDDALKILNSVYKKQKNVLGSNSPDTILTGNSIGYILREQNKLTEALKLHEESLEKCKRVLGPEHPSTLRLINSIAVILARQGKRDESIKYSKEILKIQEKIFGDDHNETLSTKHNIATNLFESGQLDEALKMYKQISSKETNSTHPDSISTKKNMLLILTLQSKVEEALKLSKELLHAQEIAFGERHRETVLTKIAMVELYTRANKNFSALKILREIFATADAEMLNTMGIKNMKTWMEDVERDINLLFGFIKNNEIETLQSFLDLGQDVNSAGQDDSTLLHFAAANGQAEIVEILLKKGADVTLVNNKGNSALHVAATNGSVQVTKLLLMYGSMHDLRNEKDVTALGLCKNESVRCLLTSVGEIFECAAKGDAQILEKLENLRSDELEAVQKTRNREGKTFLQIIIMRKYKELSKKVLEIIRDKK